MIAFKHVLNESWLNKSLPNVTVAVILPTKEQMEDVSKFPHNKFLLNLGTSFCSPNDQFKKSVGRERAEAAMYVHTLNLQSITFINGRSNYFFRGEVIRPLGPHGMLCTITVIFGTSTTSKSVKLENIYL